MLENLSYLEESEKSLSSSSIIHRVFLQSFQQNFPLKKHIWENLSLDLIKFSSAFIIDKLFSHMSIINLSIHSSSSYVVVANWNTDSRLSENEFVRKEKLIKS